MKALSAVVAMSTVLALPMTASAAGWVQDEGAFYIKAWARLIAGDSAFLADGSVEKLPAKYSDLAVQYYIEYGLTETLTVAAVGNPVGRTSFGDKSAIYTGPFRLALRYALLDGPVAVAAEGHGTIALGSCSTGIDGCDAIGAGRIGAQPYTLIAAIPSLGGGGDLQLGVAFPHGWASALVGVHFESSERIGHALYGYGQIGGDTGFGLTGDLHMALRVAAGQIDDSVVNGIGRSSYLGAGLAISYWIIDRLGVTASFDTALFARGNAASPAITLGIEFR